MKGPAPTELTGVIGVWSYRGVRIEQRGSEWATHAQIVTNMRIGGRSIRTAGRLTARGQQELLHKIDDHIDKGGEIEP